MTEQVRLDNEELQAVVASWRAAVPGATPHPPIPAAASDPRSALAAELCAPWPTRPGVRAGRRAVRAVARP